MIPIILDTDIGTDVDDALALTLAVRSPEIDILAITTVGVDPSLRGRIARKLLRVLGREDIPVAAGCDRRLDGKEFKPMPMNSARGFIENEQDGLPLQEQHAVDLIIDLLQAANTKIALVLIGPVTNAAMALKRCPQIKEKIERFVVMGGSIYPKEVYLSACLRSESLASPCADRMDRFATCHVIMRASRGHAVPCAANPQADSIFTAYLIDISCQNPCRRGK